MPGGRLAKPIFCQRNHQEPLYSASKKRPFDEGFLVFSKAFDGDHIIMRRKITTVVLGGAIGTLVCCLPVAALVIADRIVRGPGDAQMGLGIVIILSLLGPLGMIAGLIGGFVYSAGQRLLTAAAPCLGIVAGMAAVTLGGIVLGGVSHQVGLAAPAIGGVLGVLFVFMTWEPIARPGQ
jgi:hypothetical protein